MEELWHGFKKTEFEFGGKNAKLVAPNTEPNGKWALKTEYFGAFPETEIELLSRGWHIAFNQNENRWATDHVLEKKAEFIEKHSA